MFFNRLKEEFAEIFCLLKKYYLAVLLSSVFIFVVIWAGNMISVITSREILEPLTIKIEGLNETELSSVKVLATLSRAGNTINLTGVPGQSNEWNNPSQTFIKKIIFGFKNEHLDNFFQVAISLGEKNFVFTKEQFLAEWKKIDIKEEDLYSSASPNLYDKQGNSDYLVFVAPDGVKAKPLNFPVVSRLFASINFSGSEKLIQKPLISSFKLFILAEIIALISFLILFFFRQKDSRDENDASLRKRKFIVFGSSIVAVFFLLFVFNLLLAHFYKPDLSQLLENASKIYRDVILPCFLPESVEKVQFVFSILLSPFLLLIFYKLLNRKVSKMNENLISRLYLILSVAFPLVLFAIAYIGLAVSNFIYINESYSFGGSGKYLYGLLLFPLGAYLILFLKTEKYNRIIKIPIYLFAGLLIIIISVSSIFGINSKIFNNAGHFDPLLYPMAQVMSGKTILVNLTSLYGFSPVFLEGIFKLTGLGVLSFTTVMALLIGLCYLFIFIFLRRLIKNDIILLLGFSTVIFYFLERGTGDTPAIYFQYFPIRILFPCLILMLVSFYFKNKKKFLYYLITLAGALAILWNMDTGIIVFASWIITLCFYELFGTSKKIIIKNILFHLLVGLLMIGLVFFAYAVYSFLRTGLLPDFSLLGQYQNLFLSGAMAIPMPFPHIWVLAAIIFLVGLLVSIRGWQNKDNNFKNISIFFLSVVGIGLFNYYQGRSHDHNFFYPLFSVLILLAVLADLVFNDIVVNKKLYGSGLLFLLVLFFLLSSPINLIYNGGKYYRWLESGLNSFFDKSEAAITRNVAFIKSHTQIGEGIVVLSEYGEEGMYYAESGTYSVLNLPATAAIIFKYEVDYAADFLRCNSDRKLFFYPFTSREKDARNKYYFYEEKIIEIINNDYAVADKSDDDMVLLIRKRMLPADCKNQ